MKEEAGIIVVGAGPVGMSAALALYREGIPVTVLEALDEPFVDQRAATIHPPTIGMLDQLGLAEHIIPEGLIAPVYRFHDRVSGEIVAEFDLRELRDELRFPYVLQYEQYKLVKKILALYGGKPGFEVRFSSRVAEVRQDEDGVSLVVERPDGGREAFQASYLVGCDGGRSDVRKYAGIHFEGFTYPEPFIKIGTYHDFMEANPRVAIRNYFSDPEEWCNLFKVKGEHDRPIWRGVFPMRPGETEAQALGSEMLEARLQRFFPRSGRYDIAYANVYNVSQRVATTMNKGRILLAGDSAHVNNPIGGMGLNGGIHDAVNLTDKLARVWKGDVRPELLDRYTRQRRYAAVEFIQALTISNKKLMDEGDPAVRQRSLDALRRSCNDRKQRRIHMRRAALLESWEASLEVE
jgi:3-(3-hydroxy-phenyl)propionate hydroxylase